MRSLIPAYRLTKAVLVQHGLPPKKHITRYLGARRAVAEDLGPWLQAHERRDGVPLVQPMRSHSRVAMAIQLLAPLPTGAPNAPLRFVFRADSPSGAHRQDNGQLAGHALEPAGTGVQQLPSGGPAVAGLRNGIVQWPDLLRGGHLGPGFQHLAESFEV